MSTLRSGWIIGLIVTMLSATAVITVLTQPSRTSLKGLRSEADDLARRETALLERIVALNSTQSGTPTLPAEAAWDKGNAASIEVALQQALIAKAEQAGLQLVTFSETTLAVDISLPIVAVDLELIGTHEGLAVFLSLLEASEPPLAIFSLWLRQLPPDRSKPGAPISIRMTIWGFRAPEPEP